MVRKYVQYFKNMLKYVKSGGVVYVNVEQVLPSEQFAGKKVLITGGSSGFGFQMAKDFIAQGAEVMITGRNSQKLGEAKDKINNARLHTIVWDQSDCSSIINKLNEVISELGGLDIAINNAGVWNNTDWHTVDESEYDKIVDINTKGLYFLCKAEVGYFRKNNIPAKIINITSVEGNRPAFLPYGISKWGAKCLTEGLAKEVAQFGIQVNAIAPGVALTDINMQLKQFQKDNFYFPPHRFGRFTAVEEISNLAMFLASDQASNIVGQTIAVDGGWTIL